MDSSQAPEENHEIIGVADLKPLFALVGLCFLLLFCALGYELIDSIFIKRLPDKSVRIKEKQVDPGGESVRVWFAYNGQNEFIWADYGQVLDVKAGDKICIKSTETMLSKKVDNSFLRAGDCI